MHYRSLMVMCIFLVPELMIKKRGGDIDLLLVPQGETNQLKLSLTEIIVKSNVVLDCERRLGKYLKKIAQKHEPMLFNNSMVQR
ncbi:MAG: hypothetical protein WCQ90_04285 [Deltaproteobacteria bacterium]